MNTSNFKTSIFKEAMLKWRHDIHAHPETAFEEVRTSSVVAKALKSFGLEVHEGLAKTGVVGILRRGEGPSFGLRADMDALHINEETGLEYQSVYPGKMHACGHDGHTAMLLGAAKYLSEYASFKGVLYFIFQPAEENEGGARVMIEEGLFEKFPMDAVFGLHNFPGLPLGEFSIRSGGFLAACDSFHITVKGSGCHAALPQDGVDAILIGAELVLALQRIISREISALDSAVLSVTKFHSGEALNACPETAVIEGSCRHFSAEVGAKLKKRIREITESLTAASNASFSMEYITRYPPLINSAPETEKAIDAAIATVGTEKVTRSAEPVMGSEDFAFMLQTIPGAYIALGTGAGPESAVPPCMLHSAQYDFEDKALCYGADYWVSLVDKLFGV